MDTTANNHPPENIKQLAAENVQLRAMLEEYEFSITIKERELLDMKQQIATSNEQISRLDDEVMQLKLMQNYTAKQKEQMTDHPIDLLVPAAEFKHRLQYLQQQNNYLEIRIAALQTEVQDLTNRGLLLQQQASRIAELESFLADARQERDEWKALSAFKESK
jgi:chromosome segregation ATPase